jgi:hypothetical protein
MNDEESSDDDFDFDAEQGMAKRYPVHDCCEFEDADALKVRKHLKLVESVMLLMRWRFDSAPTLIVFAMPTNISELSFSRRI